MKLACSPTIKKKSLKSTLAFMLLATLVCSNKACGDKTTKRNKTNRQLVAAAEKGETSKVLALLEANADVNAPVKLAPSPECETRITYALAQAAQEGHAKVVELLLKNNALRHVKRSDGATPLTLAMFFLSKLERTSSCHEQKASDSALPLNKKQEYEQVIALLSEPSSMIMMDAATAQRQVRELVALRDASLHAS